MKRNEEILKVNGNKSFRSNKQGCFVDIHCHCLPGLDDGPATMDESLELCRLLSRDRIKTVIATPHQLGRFDTYNQAAKIREKVAAVNKELSKSNISLSVTAGADVRVDERIPELIKNDEVLTLADGGKYILLELPMYVFIDIEPLVVSLSAMGISAVISHPERHPLATKRAEVLVKWINHSASLQITAGSLLGSFGSIAQEAAWQFLNSGTRVLVATDSHNVTDRRPCMRAAFELIRNNLGDYTAELVCIENPKRVLEGKEILTVPSSKQKWGKYEQRRNQLRQSALKLK